MWIREKTDFLLMQVMSGLKFRQVDAIFSPIVNKSPITDRDWGDLMEFADTVTDSMYCTQLYVQLQHTKTILFLRERKIIISQFWSLDIMEDRNGLFPWLGRTSQFLDGWSDFLDFEVHPIRHIYTGRVNVNISQPWKTSTSYFWIKQDSRKERR